MTKVFENVSNKILENSPLLFHDLGPYHIETSPLICTGNQWTGFYMIETFVMKELILSMYFNFKQMFFK